VILCFSSDGIASTPTSYSCTGSLYILFVFGRHIYVIAVSTHQSCYPTALHACETWNSTASIRNTVPPSMYPKDAGAVVARSCHQRVDEKIGDASPVRDSANAEAEIGRSNVCLTSDLHV